MKKLYLILFLIALNSTVLLAQIYVTEAGAGNKDGTSWGNAYDNTQLQQAINQAESAITKQVWVAKGVYKPTEKLSENVYTTADGTDVATTDDRDNAFILKTGVEVYGGFSGGETSVGGRIDIHTTNQTILSGDLNNNNTADVGDAYHVVAARDDADAAVLDGFTIQHGYGDSGDFADIGGTYRIARNLGGAISFYSAKTLTFSNLIIRDNKTTLYGGAIQARSIGNDAKYDFLNVTFENNEGATRGGAVYSAGADGTNTSSINFVSCNFINNKTTSNNGNGGGAIIHEEYTLNITNSKFDGNQAGGAYGGAIRISSGIANIVSTTFENGYVGNGLTDSDADGRGGAIYSTGSATLNISGQSKFKNNESYTAGAHIYLFSGVADISDSEFEGGTAGSSAGAIYVASAASLKTTSSTFKGNTANTSGGAIYTSTTNNIAISKSKFYSNTAETNGGALYFSGVSIISVDNSVFYDNISKSTAATSGAAIYQATSGSTLTIVNSTFYANKSGCTEANGGGAISWNNTNTTRLNIYNSIFNKNVRNYSDNGGVSADFRRIQGSNSAVQHYGNNLIQSSLAAGTGRTIANNINNANPTALFASTIYGDDNFLWPVQTGVSVNAGNEKDKDNANLYTDINTATDLLGNPRANGIIDLGAIEWSTVLPVKVSSFTASLANNNRTQLKWNVGTEDNVNRYEIERSQNGADFSKVAAVSANGSASYQTTDNSPQVGDNYYRLVTIDNDGSRSQYDVIRVVKVASLATQSVQVYPNPVKGNEVRVSLDSPAGTYNYKVVSTSGSVVQQSSVNYNGSSAVINLSPVVTSGVYILYFSNGTQAKLVKQ